MAESKAPLADRRAFITGANTGIGRALALGCARHGADVLVHHLGDEPGARQVAQEIEGLGRRSAIRELDLADRDGTLAAAEDLSEDPEPIDILILNAAIEYRRPWTEIDADFVEAHVAVNLTASLVLVTHLVDAMARRGWGRVIAIGSILAARPRAETAVYASLKAAQLTALRSIAREVASHGVTVNVVSPGSILTERSREALSQPATRRMVESKIPVGRIGQPEDCVPAVTMLCSPEASYITGADIPVDGGWHIGDSVGAA